jgi:hypothetical protein
MTTNIVLQDISAVSKGATTGISDPTYIKLNKGVEDAKSVLTNYNFAYTPAPFNPFPADIASIKKHVSITPIGTYTPNLAGTNTVSQFMLKLPNPQTPETCIANAAMMRSKYITKDKLTPSIPVPQPQNITQTYKSAKLKKIITDRVENYKIPGTKKVYTPTTTTQATYIPGLHFRVLTGNYMNDNVKYFDQNGGTEEFNTKNMETKYTSDMLLPTDFSTLGTATTTTFTPNKLPYHIQQNQNKHYFNVEWWGYFLPPASGTYKFSIASDDNSFVWCDSDEKKLSDDDGIIRNISIANATTNDQGAHGMQWERSSAELKFTAGTYYPIKIQFGEQGGGYDVWLYLTGISPSVNRTANFSAMFKTAITTTVTTQVESIVDITEDATRTVQDITYERGEETEKQVNMAAAYNAAYNITENNAVYVSMKQKPTSSINGTPLYDCYINNQDAGAVTTLNSYINSNGAANGTQNSIYNAITIWQSQSQGSVYDDGFCAISKDGGVFLDGVTAISTSQAGSAPRNTSGNLPDGVPYMYIKETINGNVSTPNIYIYNPATDIISTIDVQNDTTYKNTMAIYQNYQSKNNVLWISDKANVLAYNSNNSADNPDMGIIYKIQNKDNTALISDNQTFRLIMVSGRLTLQMCINARQKWQNDDSITYIEGAPVESDLEDNKKIINNTFSLMKIDVDPRINQLNLVDKTTQKSYFIPNEFAGTFAGNYSAYNVFPPENGTEMGVAASAAECKTTCDENTNCLGYYSYKNSGTQMCKVVSSLEPGAFNPYPINSDLKESQFFVKNKEIIPNYNPDDYTIKSSVFTTGNPTEFGKKAYYPDQDYGTLNKNCANGACDPDLDVVKENLRIARKTLSDYMEGNNKSKTSTTEGMDNPATSTVCLNEATKNSYGICSAEKNLYSIQQKYKIADNNEKVMMNNYSDLKSKVSNLDTKFGALTDVSSVQNLYQYDFNDFNAKPDMSLLGALEKDTNLLLLQQNSMYMVGTIIAASIAVLGVIMARS